MHPKFLNSKNAAISAPGMKSYRAHLLCEEMDS